MPDVPKPIASRLDRAPPPPPSRGRTGSEAAPPPPPAPPPKASAKLAPKVPEPPVRMPPPPQHAGAVAGLHKASLRAPRPPQGKTGMASERPNAGLTLLPVAPSLEESDSIHPEAYGRVSRAQQALAPTLEDREGVARELISLCEAELETLQDAGRRARLHYECARLYESPLADLDAAFEHYQKARAIRPNHLPTLSGLRRVHMLQEQWSAALKALTEELQLVDAPELRGALWFERALLLEQHLSRPGEAREAYEAALQQLPADAAALRALARMHHGDERHAALRKVLDAQASLTGDDSALLAARLAERARHVELFPVKGEEPCAYYQRSVQADATASAALSHALRLYTGRGQFAEVVALEQRRAELLSDPRLCAASLCRAADLLSGHLGDAASAAALLERAAAADPSDPFPLVRLSQLYELMGDHDARVATLERLEAVANDPHRQLELCLTLAEVHHARRRDLEAAGHWLQKARQLAPASPLWADALAELHRVQGNARALASVLATREAGSDDLDLRAALLLEIAELHERELDDVERAIACYRGVLSLRPEHPGAFRALTRLLRRERRYAELVELHERALDLTPDGAQAVSHLLQAALIYEDLLQQPAAALSLFRKILERDEEHLVALRGAERIAEELGDHAVCVALIEHELGLVRGEAHRIPLLLRAAELCERGLKDEGRALAIYQEVLTLDAHNSPALAGLARLHRRAGRHAELVQALLQQVGSLKDSAMRSEQLLVIARIVDEQLADQQRALEYYRTAHEEGGGSQATSHALERALSTQERFEELAALLEERLSVTESSDERYRSALHLASVQETRLGDQEAALSSFALALEARPDSLAAHQGRARCLGQLGRFDDLVEELDRMREMTPDPVARLWALLSAGELLEGELDEPARATERFEQVLELMPDHRGALLALERLYRAQGRQHDLVRILAMQAKSFKAPAEQVAALREMTRASTGSDEADALDAQAQTGILSHESDDARALTRLELRYLSNRDSERLAEVDARWIERTLPGVVRSAHRTRLGEFLEPKNPLKALEHYRLALDDDTENVAAAHSITRLAEIVGDTAMMRQAAESEHSVVRSNRRAAALLRAAARDEQAAGHHDAAQELLTRALTIDPDDSESAMALHSLCVPLGRHDALIAVLTTAANAAKDSEVRAGHWISVARLLTSARGDVGAGIAALSRVALAQPGHVSMLLELGELYIQDRQWGAAAERLSKALESDPDPESAVALRSRLAELYHEHLDRTEDAAQLLREVIAANPLEHRALCRLLAIEIEAGAASAEATAALWTQRSSGSERAEAFTTLGRLQRDAGKSEEAKRSLAQAVALVGLSPVGADRDLIRMLEREELDGKAADWSLYTNALSSYCASEAPADSKLQALQEAASVFFDRMKSLEPGCAALRAGLGMRPRDLGLQEQLVRRLLEAREHARAVPELYKLLELAPARVETWSELKRTFDALGKHAEAHLSLGPLVVLGGGSDLERATWSSRHPNSAAVQEGSIDETVLEWATGVLAPQGLKALLAQLSSLAPKLVDCGPERFGLTTRDRVSARALNPVRVLLDRAMRMFGVDQLDLYPAAGESAVTIVLSDPMGIVIPESFANMTDSEQSFCLSHLVAHVALGTAVQAALGMEQTQLLVLAAGATVGLEPPVTGFGADQVNEMGRRLAKAVPWLSKGRFEEAARRSFADAPADLAGLFAVMHRGSLRLALVLSDDLSCLSLLKERGRALFGLDPSAHGALLDDLLRFWISPEAMAIRRQVGLS